MGINKVIKSWHHRISFHGLSLQQRLPLLICILLCSLILTFSFASYYGVKKASLEIGKKRLRTLTDQLGSMFSESSKALNTLVLTVARKDTVKKYILSGGIELQIETLEILNKLRRDSTWVLVELLDSHRKAVLRTGNENVEAKLSPDTIFSSLTVKPDSCKVGKMYAVGDSMFYPVLATITDNKKNIGYLVIYRKQLTSQKGLQQLSQLMGTGATLYIGNTDGSLWTNLIKSIPTPPVDTRHILDVFEYTNSQGKKVMAAIKPIRGTQWLVLVEFSKENILETATGFLRWIIIVGGGLIVIGIFLAWLMSRNIIKPLKQLTMATTAVAAGDYSFTLEVNRTDELGKLANAFNIMAGQIHATQSQLENKVKERTSQLEIANKELESFTYSVSHDLRAPLRAIIGYTTILEEDYTNKLDEEAKRLTTVIKNNTQKMGDLIDDLLAFSKSGRNEIVKSRINSNEIVKEVINGLAAGNIKWDIQYLPDINADIKTIKQVWINLISNAVKYSRNREQPHIEIGTFMQQWQIVFFVKDNGVGFDEKYKDKLFTVFQRLHSAEEFEGTGVGLALVEKIISKHSGKVWAEGEKDKGAVFYFSLPVDNQ